MAGKTDYDPKYCAMLIKHMSEGFSYETFSAKIGTCRRTLYHWEEQHEEWLHTKRLAQELCQYWWESAGNNGLYTVMELGDDGKKVMIEKKINQAMWIFNMKARFRWQDNDPDAVKLSGDEKALIQEYRKRIALGTLPAGSGSTEREDKD